MDTEKVEGAGDPATETTAAAETPEVTLDSLRAPPEGEQQAAPAADEKDEWLQPPSSLTPEFKADWPKLEKRWRQTFSARESDFHKGLGEYKDSHAKYQALQKELAPYQARLNAVGGLEGFTKEYALLDYYLTSGNPQQKAQAINAFAQHYGLDLSQFGKQEQQQPQLSTDPTVRALQQQLSELQQSQAQRQTAEQQRQSAFEQQREQEAAETLKAFEADPKNVYFKDVKGKMAALIANGEAKDLADAYEQACYANPAVRAAIVKQQREQEETQRKNEAAKKLADARRAAFDVQAQGAVQPGATAKTLRQELAERAGVQLSN